MRTAAILFPSQRSSSLFRGTRLQILSSLLDSHAMALFTYSASLRQKGHHRILSTGRRVPSSYTDLCCQVGTSVHVRVHVHLGLTVLDLRHHGKEEQLSPPPTPFCPALLPLPRPSPPIPFLDSICAVGLPAPSHKHSSRTY